MPISDELTADTLIVRTASVIAAEVGSDLVMLHVEKDAYYDTGAIGAQIWQALSTPTTVASICATLTASHDVSPEQCVADVLHFVRDAMSEGLVQIVR
jgi:hypothetical protein